MKIVRPQILCNNKILLVRIRKTNNRYQNLICKRKKKDKNLKRIEKITKYFKITK